MSVKGLYDRIEARLLDDVCSKCIYRTAQGGCGLPRNIPCPILTRVKDIVEVVRSVSSDEIDPYVERLRAVVCRKCPIEDEGGHCRMRDKSDCALDDYFGLIVSIVEEELAAVAHA